MGKKKKEGRVIETKVTPVLSNGNLWYRVEWVLFIDKYFVREGISDYCETMEEAILKAKYIAYNDVPEMEFSKLWQKTKGES